MRELEEELEILKNIVSEFLTENQEMSTATVKLVLRQLTQPQKDYRVVVVEATRNENHWVSIRSLPSNKGGICSVETFSTITTEARALNGQMVNKEYNLQILQRLNAVRLAASPRKRTFSLISP